MKNVSKTTAPSSGELDARTGDHGTNESRRVQYPSVIFGKGKVTAAFSDGTEKNIVGKEEEERIEHLIHQITYHIGEGTIDEEIENLVIEIEEHWREQDWMLRKQFNFLEKVLREANANDSSKGYLHFRTDY